MLQRFLKLKPVIPLLFVSTELIPADFSWRKLERVCNVLKPLQEHTLLLQGENVGLSLAVKTVNFLKHLTNSDPALNSPTIGILKKHTDSNSIVDAVMYKHGEFYKHLKSMHQLQVGNQDSSSDQEYTSEHISF